MRRHRPLVLLLAAGAAAWACLDPVYGTPEYDVRIERTESWSGGQITLHSAAFVPPASPRFTVNDRYLRRERRDDTSFVVSLPDLPGTRITITVVFPDDTVWVGPITLHGFRDARLGPPLKGTPQIWPGPPSVLMAGAKGLVQYNLRENRITQTWSDSLHDSACDVSPGTSYRSPNHVVLQRRTASGECGPPVSWNLWPVPTPSDSAAWGCCAWALVELAPGRWLVTRDDWFEVLDCADGTCPRGRQFPMTADLAVLSPRSDRVALPGWSSTGPYVLDTSTGDSAYSIPLFAWGDHAAFSPDGDTLFMTGTRRTTTGEFALVSLSAADGALLDSLTLPMEIASSAVAVDPVSEFAYVAVVEIRRGASLPPNWPWPYGFEPALLVFRRASLELVATLRVPPERDQVNAGLVPWDLAVVPSPADATIYVLLIPWTYDTPTSDVRIYRWDRLP